MAKKYSIYLKHEDGATHFLHGATAAKIYKEVLKSNSNGNLWIGLIMEGYVGFIGKAGTLHDMSEITPDQFDVSG